MKEEITIYLYMSAFVHEVDLFNHLYLKILIKVFFEIN